MATTIAYLEQFLTNKNIQAALHVIRTTEGTTATDGYFYMFGSSPKNKIRFMGTKHQNMKQTHNGITSTAAGAYQILYDTYKELCSRYGFKDFTPRSQDLMCLALFDGLNVLNLIATGHFLQADVMKKLASKWASLPESPYGQPTHTMAQVSGYYSEAGGSVA